MEDRGMELKDDYACCGNDIESLLDAAEMIDENTTVEKLDYAYADIFTPSGANGRIARFAVFGHDTKDVMCSKMAKTKEGSYCRTMCVANDALLDIVDLQNTMGIFYELSQAFHGNGERLYGTAFYFSKESGRDKDLLLFTSPVSHKTLYSRFGVKTMSGSFARDLQLHDDLYKKKVDAMAQNGFDVSKSLIGYYTVMRGTGMYRKLIAVFVNENCRVPFFTAVDAVCQYDVNCIRWDFQQANGITADFTWSGLDMDEEDIPYRPVVGLRVCDSGKVSNKLLCGWHDPQNPESSIQWTHQYKILGITEGNGEYTINACTETGEPVSDMEDVWKKDLQSDLDIMKAWRKSIECGSPEDLVERFLSRMNFKDVGGRVRNAMKKYMHEQASPKECETSWYTLYQRFVSGISTCEEAKCINLYAQEQLHRTCICALFSDKTHL